MTNQYPHVFWINLKRSPERKTTMENLFKNHNIDRNTRIDAIDGKSVDFLQFVINDLTAIKATRAEIGCTLSHLTAILTAYESNLSEAIILEDDARFTQESFALTMKSLKLINNPNLEILQLVWILGDQEHLLKKVFDAYERGCLAIPHEQNIYCTAAYYINRKGMESILNKHFDINCRKFQLNGCRYENKIQADNLIFGVNNNVFTLTKPCFSYDKVLLSTIEPKNRVFHTQSLSLIEKLHQLRPIRPLVQIIAIEVCKPLLVMQYVFKELATAFLDFDCNIVVVKSVQDMQDGGIAFVDNSLYVENQQIYTEIGRKCPNTVFIAWYWEQTDLTPFKKIIYTGENWLIEPKHSVQMQNRYMNYMKHYKFVPLLLRASDHPDKIGTYQRNVQRDYCYMGSPYKQDWLPNSDLYSGLYHAGHWDCYLSYDQRREIYLGSTFAFAFQSDANIETGHLSQRIFEGLAYGCVVLCENKLASELTEGAVVYIKDKIDLVDKMKLFMENKDLIAAKQQQGYDWIKKFGTNRYSVDLMLLKIKEIYNLQLVKSV